MHIFFPSPKEPVLLWEPRSVHFEQVLFFTPKNFTQNFTQQGYVPTAFAALFCIPHSAPFPFKVLQLIIYKTQEVTLSPGCAHLKSLKTKYGISLCCFSQPLRKPKLYCFPFFVLSCHVEINWKDQQSTQQIQLLFLSFNRSWKQRASSKDKNVIGGHHWFPLQLVFSWVNRQTVPSPFVPPAKPMVHKSSQKTGRNSLSFLQQVRIFLKGICLHLEGRDLFDRLSAFEEVHHTYSIA